ncbi:MAG: DUF6236 family protein [Nitrospirota bacterium]
MNRGVIASPGIIKPMPTMPGVFEVWRNISREELRYYILYWDKVVIPSNSIVDFVVPEEEELIACEAISRPLVVLQVRGNQVVDVILASQSIVAQKLVRDKNIDWVIHQISDSLTLPADFVYKQDLIRVALVNLLPVPNGEVPIHEILEFKQRRKDELNELHNSIDELYCEILNSPDEGLATKKVLSRFHSCIQNLNKVSHEKFKKTRKFDFSAELNINGKDIISGATRGALLDFFSNGFTIPIATILGAVVPCIKITANTSCTFEPAKENTKLAYLADASKENIINSTIANNN